MGALQDLFAAVDRLNRLTGQIQQNARRLPDDYARRIEGMRVVSSYAYERLTPEDNKLASDLLKQMRDREFARGKSDRDAILRKTASEIEALRATLPALAAAAAIEVGGVTRALADEAGEL